MTEAYQISPGVRMTVSSDDVGLPPNSADLQRVILWDIGPEKPKPPQKPTLPKGKEGDPEYELARVEFQDSLTKFDVALREHGRLKLEYEK